MKDSKLHKVYVVFVELLVVLTIGIIILWFFSRGGSTEQVPGENTQTTEEASTTQ